MLEGDGGGVFVPSPPPPQQDWLRQDSRVAGEEPVKELEVGRGGSPSPAGAGAGREVPAAAALSRTARAGPSRGP